MICQTCGEVTVDGSDPVWDTPATVRFIDHECEGVTAW
jgi:hypothetical protein